MKEWKWGRENHLLNSRRIKNEKDIPLGGKYDGAPLYYVIQ